MTFEIDKKENSASGFKDDSSSQEEEEENLFSKKSIQLPKVNSVLFNSDSDSDSLFKGMKTQKDSDNMVGETAKDSDSDNLFKENTKVSDNKVKDDSDSLTKKTSGSPGASDSGSKKVPMSFLASLEQTLAKKNLSPPQSPRSPVRDEVIVEDPNERSVELILKTDLFNKY